LYVKAVTDFLRMTPIMILVGLFEKRFLFKFKKRILFTLAAETAIKTLILLLSTASAAK
jgi:hypothetical protein